MNKAVIVIVTANNKYIYWLFCWTDEEDIVIVMNIYRGQNLCLVTESRRVVR